MITIQVDQIRMLDTLNVAHNRVHEIRETLGHLMMLATCVSHSIPKDSEGDMARENWQGVVASFVELTCDLDDLTTRIGNPAAWYVEDASDGPAITVSARVAGRALPATKRKSA